ncbi:MAG: hypothetical protein AB1762_01235 [Gemmatimonadota bacterium]
MQTLVEVHCKRGRSLREAIANDPRLGKHGLEMLREHQPGRAPGWAKLRGTQPDRQGTINMVWDASTHVLSCRVVNRGRGKPNLIIGDLVDYLLARHRARIVAILVVPKQRPTDAN